MRQDLRSLTPEALAALSNWGLVKRAQREPAPLLDWQEDGLYSLCSDGARCFFSSDLPAVQGSCSCGASGWCRHQVATLLACSQPADARPEDAFLPVDLGRLEKQLGKRLWSKALAQKSRGMVVQVQGPPWQACLPGCTVRFLLGTDVDYCKCDCEHDGPCEHWALAAWALNQLGGQPGEVSWGEAQGSSHNLDHTRQWLEELVLVGLSGAAPLWRVWQGRVTAEISHCAWLRVLVAELIQLSEAFQHAASNYSSSRWLFCLLSLACRLRDGSAQALGLAVAWEQELEHSRLFSLGCRRLSRETQVYWTDETGLVLVQTAAPDVQNLPGLGRVSEAACSQVVSRGLVRRADGGLRFRRERNRHSLTRLTLDWRNLPPSLVWPGLDAWKQRRQSQLSSLLRRPRLAGELWVIPLAWARCGGYDPGQQRLLARVGDLHGGEIQIFRRHEKECPGALDALAWGLPQARWLTGFVGWEDGAALLEPVSLVTVDQVIPLDLHRGAEAFNWPVNLQVQAADPLLQLLQDCLSLCQHAAQVGLSQLLPSFQQRRLELAARLSQAGMPNLSRSFSKDWSFWRASIRAFLALERTG